MSNLSMSQVFTRLEAGLYVRGDGWPGGHYCAMNERNGVKAIPESFVPLVLYFRTPDGQRGVRQYDVSVSSFMSVKWGAHIDEVHSDA